MNEALAWSAAQGVRELEVATQVSNPSALAFYEAMKFRTKETFLIYHWWL
jgi:ribosomal protein S18 acetylase RimI-like enzyme